MGEMTKEALFEFFIENVGRLQQASKRIVYECSEEKERNERLIAGKRVEIFLSEKKSKERIAHLKEFYKQYDELRNKIAAMAAGLELYYQEQIKTAKKLRTA